VDDLAAACVFLLEKYNSPEIINVGCGEDISIRELAELICDIVGFQGELAWDTTKPDGPPRKLLDVSKIHALGWRHQIALREGIERTYEWFLENEK
jgi:GDP-L-fucose synthase